MSSRRKGLRNERKAGSVFERLGFSVERVKHTRYGSNDFFGVFDLFCLKEGVKPVLVQVKSNDFGGISKLTDNCGGLVDLDFVCVEFWVWKDYNGWEIRRLDVDDDGGFVWNVLCDESVGDCLYRGLDLGDVDY